jgi:hypothetical protein
MMAIDHDTSAIIDPPETPAPVFAVRAFKHAIFGTPQQAPLSTRRHSANERERRRPVTTARTTRPQLLRPKSAGDAAGITGRDDVPEPMPSPTKGILMTPGTAAARRKTVTFGEYVVDNAKEKVKDGSKTGLPADFPGKFPSPWVQPTDKKGDTGTPNEWKRGRSKLTEDLHKAREESAKKKAAENGDIKLEEQNYSDAEEPDSESGRYWKREFDMYRENTTREVKKLIAKQRAAKGFARDKDTQCTELADQLRQERKKVEKLEMRAAELEAQVNALQAQVNDGCSSSPTRNARTSARRSVLVGEGAMTAARPAHPRSRSSDQPSKPALDSELGQNQTEAEPRRTRTVKSSLEPPAESADVRPRVRHQPGNLPSDVWNHSTTNEGPDTPSKAGLQINGTRNGRAVTSGTNLTPLKSLSINSQQKSRTTQQDLTPRSPDAERQAASTPAFLRDNPALAPRGNEAKDPIRCDSLDFESETKAEPLSEKPSAYHPPLLPSSPFDPDGRAHPLATAAAEKPLPSRPVQPAKADSKENVNPSRAAVVGASSVKDTAVNLQVPRAGVTGAPMRGKDGSEVSEDRLAAAKARLAARGRKIS